MGFLPTQKTEIKKCDPRNLIMYGTYKVGKSTALSQLPNALILDLENGGYDYLSGYIKPINSYIDLYKTAMALNKTKNGVPNLHYEEHSFKFVVIDTMTALEDIALDLAAKRYAESPKLMGL